MINEKKIKKNTVKKPDCVKEETSAYSTAITSPTKKLDIGFRKICNCQNSHINCMTAKEWLKSQIGVWQFYYEGRDVRDKNLHPATFPISLSKKIIALFTHEGELVLYPFVGSGTTLVAARDLNRNAVGFDFKPNMLIFVEQGYNSLLYFQMLNSLLFWMMQEMSLIILKRILFL